MSFENEIFLVLFSESTDENIFTNELEEGLRMNPLYDLDNKVTALVNGEYRTNEGKYIRGAYTTIDDSLILVNVNVFDRLIYKGVSYQSDVDFDEAVKQYVESHKEELIKGYIPENMETLVQNYIEEHKEEIALGYLEEQKQQEEIRKKEDKERHLQEMREQRSRQAKNTEAMIVKCIILGYSRQQIMDELQLSSTTVAKVIKKLSKDYVSDIYCYNKYTIFKGVSVNLIDRFMSVNCSYKGLQQLLRRKQLESEKDRRAFMEKVNKVTEDLGFSGKNNTHSEIKSEAEVDPDKPLDLDDILAIVNDPERVSVAEQAYLAIQASAKNNVRIDQEKADRAIEKMNSLKEKNKKGTLPSRYTKRGFISGGDVI